MATEQFTIIGLAKKLIWVLPYDLIEKPKQIFGKPNIYRMWLTFFFLLDSALTEEETEGQRGKMTRGSLQSNTEAEFQSGFQTGTPDQCF